MFVTKKVEWCMKNIFFSLFIFLSLLCTQSLCGFLETQDNCCFTGAFTAGYVFKFDDHLFKEVYGQGMGNVITGDICYHPWECWGIGGKLSYWLAFGRTTLLERHTTLQQIPMTIYLRRLFDFTCGLQLYASLGGGATWIREKSYLGHTHQWRGIGEAEVGSALGFFDGT